MLGTSILCNFLQTTMFQPVKEEISDVDFSTDLFLPTPTLATPVALLPPTTTIEKKLITSIAPNSVLDRFMSACTSDEKWKQEMRQDFSQEVWIIAR